MIGKDTVERMKPGHLLHHYFLASFCYYQLDLSPMTDEAFDRLCVRLDEQWDVLDEKQYRHKTLVNREELKAGTCLLHVSKYPHIVFNVAHDYLAACINRSILAELEPHLLVASPRPTRIVRGPQPASKPVPAAPAAAPPPRRITRSRPT